MGVQIVPKEDGLGVLVIGRAQKIRWYRVDTESGWRLQEASEASDGLFTPQEDGIYVVAAIGKNVAYNPVLKNNGDYKVNGQPKLVAQETVTMYSAPYVFTAGKAES